MAKTQTAFRLTTEQLAFLDDRANGQNRTEALARAIKCAIDNKSLLEGEYKKGYSTGVETTKKMLIYGETPLLYAKIVEGLLELSQKKNAGKALKVEWV